MVTLIQKDAPFNLDCKQINLIPNKSFRFYKQYSLIILRIFDNEDEIFIFSRNVQKSTTIKNYLKKNKIKKYYEILTVYQCLEK